MKSNIYALLLAFSAAVMMTSPAAARGFGDNDTSKYFAKSDEGKSASDVSKAPARMAVGEGEHWVSWLEFVTSDADATAAFFGDVFGWEVVPFMEGYSLWMPSQTEGIVGCGFSTEDMGQAATYYIYEPDIDGRLAAIEADGGSIVMPKVAIAEGMPSIALFVDNSGVTVGLVDGALPAVDVPFAFGEGSAAVPDRFCSVEIYSADFAATGEFFRDHFGWDTVPAMDGYLSWNSGAGLNGVFQGHTPDSPVIAYIYSSDVHATIAAVEAAGGTSLIEPMSMPGLATFGYFSCPGGVVMGLIGPE